MRKKEKRKKLRVVSDACEKLLPNRGRGARRISNAAESAGKKQADRHGEEPSHSSPMHSWDRERGQKVKPHWSGWEHWLSWFNL